MMSFNLTSIIYITFLFNSIGSLLGVLGYLVSGSEFAQAGNIRAWVVVHLALASQAHPVGAHVVGRENDPLGADALEIRQQLPVALVDLRGVEARVVHEL